MKRKTTPMVEFKSDDEAWYDVFINIVEGSSLKIHYKGLPKSDDQVLPLQIFKTAEDVRARFRISAEQLQDEHCRKLKKEMLISASCSSDGRDLKYFNAVVKEICQFNHFLVDGEEECKYQFKVLWQAGPKINQMSYVSCGNICLLSTRSIDAHPKINALLKLVERKFCSQIGSSVQAFEGTPHPGSVSLQFKGKEKKVDKKIISIESAPTNSHGVLGVVSTITQAPPVHSLMGSDVNDNECKCRNTFMYSPKGIVFKEDHGLDKIPKVHGNFGTCIKGSLPSTSLDLFNSNSNSKCEIAKEVIVDINIYNGHIEEQSHMVEIYNGPIEEQSHMVENDERTNMLDLDMQVGSQANFNMVKKEEKPLLVVSSPCKEKGLMEKEQRPFPFDLNVPIDSE